MVGIASGIPSRRLAVATVLAVLALLAITVPAAMKSMNHASEQAETSFATNLLPLTGEWAFAIDAADIGMDEGWAGPNFVDSEWTTVTVPHTWGVMPEYADYEGVAWYRRAFTIPTGTTNALLRLGFDAVFYRANVWLNGEYLGTHEGGYTPFEFDVSALVRLDAANVLAVRVDNRRSVNRIPATLRGTWSFDWWNWGGIVRGVSLKITNRTYIAKQHVTAIPHLTGTNQAETATVAVTVSIRNLSDETVEGTLVGDVLDDKSGQSVLKSQIIRSVSLIPGETSEVELAVEVSEPKLWHFDHPNMYRWLTVLQDAAGKSLHVNEVTFGIRLIELKDARFYLNGESMRFVGLTRHADSPQHGLAETVTFMAQDYDDLKILNVVFSRPVHYPQHEFILDYCDRNGILLIPEVPAWQLTRSQMRSPEMRALEQQQLREMIDSSYNHPSIWAWSIGNEYESGTLEGHAFTRDMIAYVKTLDPSRPVGFASHQLAEHPMLDATTYADFVMMNQYFGTWHARKTDLSQALDAIHSAWPDKVVMISEYGFEPHWNTLMGWPSETLDQTEYYILPEQIPSGSSAADALRQQVIREQMAVFRSKPFVAAAIFWTYQDYRTPSGFVMGVVDEERNRRDSWYLLKEEHSPILIESLSMLPSANGQLGAEIELRSRGADDMPSYILREYSLHWCVTSPNGEQVLAEDWLNLPTLDPGAKWSSSIMWTDPRTEYVLTVRVVRPTGFEAIKRVYDSEQVLGDAD